ncbi:MAG: hypothetical protein ACR2RE_14640 [Geminicoccaceae bacterium]
MTDTIQDLRSALGNLLEQAYQMQGMFPDEDSTISNAITDGEDALAREMEARKSKGEGGEIVVIVSGGLVQSATKGGQPFIVTVHDYDVDGDDPAKLERDTEGGLFNSYRT